MTASNLAKLGNTPDFHPLDYEDVSFVIKAGSVRADKTTDRKLVTSLLPEILPAIEAHLPEVSNHLIAPVNDRHVREEIGDDEQSLAFVKVARVREAVDEAEVLPLQSKQLKALVGAIGDSQNRRFPAVVHSDAVGTG
jgi:hypothetical protein